jgi:hypothetical protein
MPGDQELEEVDLGTINDFEEDYDRAGTELGKYKNG